MPTPSDLTITTKAVQRLVKEEGFYRSELGKQQERVGALQADVNAGGPDLDANAEFVLKQESKAVDETKAVFGPLRKRTADAVTKLEEQIALSESSGVTSEEELGRAREALKSGQEMVEKTDD